MFGNSDINCSIHKNAVNRKLTHPDWDSLSDRSEVTMKFCLSHVVCLCAGFLMAVNAQAAFQVVENFDSLILGNISGQNGWSATSGSGEVVLDPADDSNRILKATTESGILHKAVSVAQGTRRMLFLRFRFEEHGRFSFGISHLPNPDEFSDFGPELGMAADTASDPNNDFRVANGLLPSGIYDVLRTLSPGIWYNIWIFVDNSSDTYQVWMNSNRGGNAQVTDQLENSTAEKKFGFRTSTIKGLISFFIKTGGGKSPVDGRFYIDDIYLEDTDDTNLDNPIALTQYLQWLPLLLLDE